MKWYYQPVHVSDDPDDGVTVVEVYEDDSGRVLGWCARDAPVGNNHDDLIGDLERMLADVRRNLPITKDALRKLMRE